MTEPLLRVRDLRKHFPARRSLLGVRQWVQAVDGVTFDILEGEIFGLVGESGSGKSTLGRCLLRLLRPTSGEILYDGRDLATAAHRELKPLRREFQIVFQNPTASLNPRMTVRDLLVEPLRVHFGTPAEAALPRILELLRHVGLGREHLWKYPHELSGGQCQRVAIARALTVEPRFLVLDEPTSALDVSVQAQIVNLLRRLQREFRLTYLFVTHDISLAAYLADRIGVMYLGKLVEVGPTEAVLERPRHPYTHALRAAVPDFASARGTVRVPMRGEPPSPTAPPSGCRFRTRCPIAQPDCAEVEPLLRMLDGRLVACHYGERVRDGVLEEAEVPT